MCVSVTFRTYMLSRCAYAKKYATAERDFVLKFSTLSKWNLFARRIHLEIIEQELLAPAVPLLLFLLPQLILLPQYFSQMYSKKMHASIIAEQDVSENSSQ